MQDLTRVLIDLAARRRDRWSAETESLVATVSSALGGRVDWDADAGEDWATIVTEPTGAGALVQAQAPLVICTDAAKLGAIVPSDVVIVQVDDRESADLRADPAALAALFGADALPSEFESEGFSAGDLWFWTIQACSSAAIRMTPRDPGPGGQDDRAATAVLEPAASG